MRHASAYFLSINKHIVRKQIENYLALLRTTTSLVLAVSLRAAHLLRVAPTKMLEDCRSIDSHKASPEKTVFPAFVTRAYGLIFRIASSLEKLCANWRAQISASSANEATSCGKLTYDSNQKMSRRNKLNKT